MIRETPESLRLQKIIADVMETWEEPATRLPGVTRFLSGTKDMTGLDAWRKRLGDEEADRILKESKDIGTSLDTLFNDSLLLSDFNIEDHKDELGYKLWKQLTPYLGKVVPVGVQLKVWNTHLGYMGYLDCLGIYDGKLCIIDCKNSKREKTEEYLEDYYLQCTAYALAIFKMFGIKVHELVLMIARRDSPFPQIIRKPIAPYIPRVLERAKRYHETQSAKAV